MAILTTIKQSIFKIRDVLSPVQLVTLIISLIILLQVIAFYVVVHQPWSGIQLKADLNANTLYINDLHPVSPNIDSFKKGEIVSYIWLNEERIKPINSIVIDLKEIATFKDYNDFKRKQGEIYRPNYNNTKIYYELASGKKIPLKLLDHVPIKGVPFMFWLLFSVNIVSVIISLVVWLVKPYSFDSGLLLSAGLGHYGLTVIYSVIISRDIFMSPLILQTLLYTQMFFMHIFAFSMFSIQVSYPQRLLPVKYLVVIAGMHLLSAINYCGQWLQIPFHIFFLQYIPGFFIAMLFTVKQWMVAKYKPVNRSAIIVAQLSVIVPSLVLIFLYAVPVILNKPPLINELIINVMPIFLFLGWAIAILRYKLFEFEIWWLKTLLWLLFGSLVLILDALFVYILNFSQLYSLEFAVLIVGFFYFPLRQKIINYFMPMENMSLTKTLALLNEFTCESKSMNDFEMAWLKLLQYRFQPLNIDRRESYKTSPELVEYGLHLHIPNLAGNACICLTGKNMGKKLFSKNNLVDANSLLIMTRTLSNASNARQTDAQKERTRIMHNLHDTMGAKLLTLARTLPTPANQQVARDALQLLRDIISLTLRTEPCTLATLLPDWRVELTEQAENQGIQLEWSIDESIMTVTGSPVNLIAVKIFLFETLQQLLFHSLSSSIFIKFQPLNEKAQVNIEANGIIYQKLFTLNS